MKCLPSEDKRRGYRGTKLFGGKPMTSIRKIFLSFVIRNATVWNLIQQQLHTHSVTSPSASSAAIKYISNMVPVP